jgi:NitT/TauT family transport system substrate-binding protein
MRAAPWIVLLAALLAGRAALADDKLRVGTPEPTAFVFAAVDVGIDSGIFAKYGLQIERIDFAGGAKLHQAMAAGSLDIIVGTGSDLLFLARGAPERGVAAYANDLNSLSLVARADDDVKTLADVKGKTVGTTTTGSFTSWIAKQIATKQGWGPDGIKLAYLGAQSGLVAGLMAKNVDAIVGTSAGGLLLEQEGRARIIVRAGDMITEFIADIIYASEPMMNEHPDQLRRFLRAWFDVMHFMKENKAETIRLTQKDTHLPDAIAAQIYDTEMPTFFTDGHFNRKNFAAVKQSLIDVGVVETMPADDALITEKFLP